MLILLKNVLKQKFKFMMYRQSLTSRFRVLFMFRTDNISHSYVFIYRSQGYRTFDVWSNQIRWMYNAKNDHEHFSDKYWDFVERNSLKNWSLIWWLLIQSSFDQIVKFFDHRSKNKPWIQLHATVKAFQVKLDAWSK